MGTNLNALSPAGCWSIASNTIFEHHFACVHSYRRSSMMKNLLLRKLQYWKRGLALTLLNTSRNVQMVVAVILVSSLSYSKSGEWLTGTKRSFFRSGIWKMRNPSEKVSFKRWVALRKESMPSWKLIFQATKDISLPSTIARHDVEQSCRHRPLKRTYAVAGQLIRSKQEQKLTYIVRSDRPQFYYYPQGDQMEKNWQDWSHEKTRLVRRRILWSICQMWHLPDYYDPRCIQVPPGGLRKGCSCRRHRDQGRVRIGN